MSTFSDPLFPASNYATFRPTYPTTLYSHHLLPYHRRPFTHLLDLGCGPGNITRSLSPYFYQIHGIDPSPSMLTTAVSLTPSSQYPNISYLCHPAENIPEISDASIDMVVSGQAAHWFFQPDFWREMERVIKPEGTIALWGYSEFLFPRFPEASRILRGYSEEEGKLGGYWQQPGRGVVERRYRDIVPPGDNWEGVRRLEFEPGFEVPVKEETERRVRRPVVRDRETEETGELMRSRLRLREVEEYVRTWSCVHKWILEHPEVKRLEGMGDGFGKGDIIDDMFLEMAEVEGWKSKEEMVDIVWGHGILLARRK
ncbi:S-adenosyl-L-methionine-dependent methyltransferase [Pyronema omphalodes]|nr:S-adenosyl-L-methionine-dependent methyltransferase [Pyronema omphalodes]